MIRRVIEEYALCAHCLDTEVMLRTLIETKCESCGVMFTTKNSKKKYCNRRCHVRAYHRRAKERRVVVQKPPDPSLPGEEWRTIDGHGGLYEVSNMGRVRRSLSTKYLSVRVRPGRVLSMQVTDKGYRRIHLMHKVYSVHRLVGKTFIPNLHNKPEVNHKNGVKGDNRVENLEWVTSAENRAHAKATGLIRP